MDKEIQSIIDRIQARRIPDIPVITPTYECEKCKDVEYVFYTDDRGYEMAKPCECKPIKEAKRRMQRSGISEDDLQKGFNDFLTLDEKGLDIAKRTAIKYFKDFESIQSGRVNSILLCGASGRGKTTLGLAIANNLMKAKNTAVVYMQYRDEVTNLKQMIIDEDRYNARMEKLKSARVLFIDDLLKGKVTESDLNIIYEIINHRYLAKLPMIISTEKTTDELMEFDEAVGGRIVEMTKNYIVVFDKSIPNYRLRKE